MPVHSGVLKPKSVKPHVVIDLGAQIPGRPSTEIFGVEQLVQGIEGTMASRKTQTIRLDYDRKGDAVQVGSGDNVIYFSADSVVQALDEHGYNWSIQENVFKISKKRGVE